MCNPLNKKSLNIYCVPCIPLLSLQYTYFTGFKFHETGRDKFIVQKQITQISPFWYKNHVAKELNVMKMLIAACKELCPVAQGQWIFLLDLSSGFCLLLV